MMEDCEEIIAPNRVPSYCWKNFLQTISNYCTLQVDSSKEWDEGRSVPGNSCTSEYSIYQAHHQVKEGLLLITPVVIAANL